VNNKKTGWVLQSLVNKEYKKKKKGIGKYIGCKKTDQKNVGEKMGKKNF